MEQYKIAIRCFQERYTDNHAQKLIDMQSDVKIQKSVVDELRNQETQNRIKQGDIENLQKVLDDVSNLTHIECSMFVSLFMFGQTSNIRYKLRTSNFEKKLFQN